jgi:hypothetical protein
MLSNRPGPPVIRPLAAAHFRDALTASQSGDIPVAVGALLAIDNESWAGIVQRLDYLGGAVTDLITSSDVRPNP